MARKHTRSNAAAAHDSAPADELDPRIKLASRALTVGTRLAPVAVRLWRWRAAIRIAISVVMVAIPLIARIRALRSTAAREPEPYRLPRPVRPLVLDDRAVEAEADELPGRHS